MKLPLLLLAGLVTITAWVTQPTKPHAPLEAKKTEEIREPPLPAIHAAAPVNRIPPAAPTIKPPSALELALEAGDVCETARQLANTDSPIPLFTAFLAATSPSAELREVFGENGPMLGLSAGPQKYKTLSARTLWALKQGGVLNGVVSAPNDLKSSRALLLELGKNEPGNAFYPFMRLAVESKLGLDKEILQTTAAEIAAGSAFDSHLHDVESELRELSFGNPALYYAIDYYYSFGPVPYFRAVRELLKVGAPDAATSLARLMTEEGLHSTRPSRSGEFETNRYVQGRNLDPSRYPELSALDRDRRRGPTTYAPSVKWNGPEVCDPGPFERYFLEEKESR